MQPGVGMISLSSVALRANYQAGPDMEEVSRAKCPDSRPNGRRAEDGP